MCFPGSHRYPPKQIKKYNYQVAWVNTTNGDVEVTRETVKGGGTITVKKKQGVLWLKRK